MTLEEITKYLSRGDHTRIAKLCQVTRSSVSRYLSGEVKKSKVRHACLLLAQRRKKEMEEKIAQLKI